MVRWDKAPTRAGQNRCLVTLRPVSVVDLPFEILEDACWKPQALGARRRNEGSSAARKQARIALLRGKWPKEEIWVNAALDQILAASPPRLLGDAFPRFGGSLTGTALRLQSERVPTPLRKHVGDPDFVLWDQRQGVLVLGEVKIGATKSNARYSFEQFSKYMLYGALVQLSGLAKTVTHVVIAPSTEPTEFCNDAESWHPKVDGVSGRLSVAPKRMQLGRQKRGYRDFGSWREYAREQLTDKEWMAANGDYTPAAVVELLEGSSAPVLVPTYVVTWDRLCGELVRACGEQHAGHLVPAIEQLRRLGKGEATEPRD